MLKNSIGVRSAKGPTPTVCVDVASADTARTRSRLARNAWNRAASSAAPLYLRRAGGRAVGRGRGGGMNSELATVVTLYVVIRLFARVLFVRATVRRTRRRSSRTSCPLTCAVGVLAWVRGCG